MITNDTGDRYVKLHIEGTTSTSHEGVETLTSDEVAEYRALKTDDERGKWLEEMAREIVQGGEHEYETEIDDVIWRLEEDE